jgi:uncharacterized protein YlzI (FlbEa/FlbD family)
MKKVIEILKGELCCAKNSLEQYVAQLSNSENILARNKARADECANKIIELNRAISLLEKDEEKNERK